MIVDYYDLTISITCIILQLLCVTPRNTIMLKAQDINEVVAMHVHYIQRIYVKNVNHSVLKLVK